MESNCQEYDDTSSTIHNDKIKINRREIERQRRQEMATLWACLRSRLPLKYIKGKRSTAEHLAEAVNYIKDLEKNIEELSLKRDKLKKISFCDASDHDQGSSDCSEMNHVIVYPTFGGVKVVFGTGFSEENTQLSGVLETLLEEGLNVVSCASTNLNEKLVHTIHCEVIDMNCFNLSGLQRKLNKIVIGGGPL